MFQMVVDNYQEERPYAQSYAQRRFASACRSLAPAQSDWTPTMPPAWHEEVPPVRITDASLAFSCDTSDGPRIANVYAATAIHSRDGLWTVRCWLARTDCSRPGA